MNLKLQIDNQQLLIKLGRIRDVGYQAMPQIYTEFVKNTPIGDPQSWTPPRTIKNYTPGNARRQTTLQGKRIHADYGYAQVLDAGRGFRDGQMRGSKQAPEGMSTPTRKFAVKLLRQLLQKAYRNG